MAQRLFRSDDTSVWQEGFGNGGDGALTISGNTTEAPIDSSCSGTATSNSLSATNASFAPGQIIFIHQSRGTGAGTNMELNYISSYTAGTITTKYPLIYTYTDSGASQAQVRVMKQYSSVTINNAINYIAKAWDGNIGGILGWFCNGTTTIAGTLTVVGKGFAGGGGGFATSNGTAGESALGAGAAGTSANGAGGGGGDDDSGGPSGGGGGGYGAGGNTGGDGSAAGEVLGEAGGTDGNAGLTDMVFGGAGGGGGSGHDGNWQAGGAGGNGGGIAFIVSKTFTVTGAMAGTGQVGSAGANSSAGGGGGAGGSILIKGQTVTLGSSLVTAAGGGGGAGSSGGGDTGGAGGDGGVGRIHVDYKTSISGTTSPAVDSRQDASLVDPAMAGGILTLL